MNAEELLEKWKEVFEQPNVRILAAISANGKKPIYLKFGEVMTYAVDLAEYLIDEPAECINAAELAFEDIYDYKTKVRVYDLPKLYHTPIHRVRIKYLNKMIALTGVIKQKTAVLPETTSSKYECPGCGNIIPIIQLSETIQEPKNCSCGRKGKFNLVSEEITDFQALVLEEPLESAVSGDKSQRIHVFLRSDLTSPENEKKLIPGNNIIVNGVLIKVPEPTKTGGVSTKSRLVLDCVSVRISSVSAVPSTPSAKVINSEYTKSVLLQT